ncbi:MAG: oligosaccharyl transferase, archaeosortase A system-associated [Dehalococcoidia bacterium]
MLKRIPSWIIPLLLLGVIVAVALWIRIILPYSQVFVNDWVKVTGVDGNFYMRLTENLAAHFPNLTQFDPYYIFPDGVRTDREPLFFAYMLGGIAWLAGLGHPSPHMVDVVAVYVPPILAALSISAAFFIGKAIANKWVGLIAAALIAVMPGEFLNRSLLGYTDHHVAEVLWSTLFILLTMLAYKFGEDINIKFVREKGWKPAIKPLVMCILAGLALAFYMATWAGAALFILVLFAFMVIQLIMDYKRGVSPLTTGTIGAAILLVALIVYLPMGEKTFFTLLALAGGIAATIIMVALALWMAGRKIRTLYYIVCLAALAMLGTLGLYIVNSQLLSAILDAISRVFVWAPATTIMEMQPLLLQQGQFTLLNIWSNYTTALLLGLAGLGLLFYSVVKKSTPLTILMIVWTILSLLSALALRRFAYYFAVNIALLAGYFAWWLLEKAGFGRTTAVVEVQPTSARTKASRNRLAKAEKKKKSAPVLMALTLIVVIFVLIYPDLGPLPDGQKPAIDLASRPLFAPSNAWFASLDWMRKNTPEPLGDANDYYALYKAPGEPGGFVYPENTYGVLSWWDYGYWITLIGRRIPFSNPGTSAERGEAKFFMAPTEPEAEQSLNGINIRYVIIDNQIAAWDSKFFALAQWYGKSYRDYYDIYLQKQGDNYSQVLLLYPEYYQTMVVRLYNFDGKAVTPDEVNAVGFQSVTAKDGTLYNLITDTKKFNTYSEAQAFVAAQTPGTYRIVGEDPFKSPVPLEAIKDYKPVHVSEQNVTSGTDVSPEIKIFEYQK